MRASTPATMPVLTLLGVDGSEYATHLVDLAREAIRHRTRWSPSLPAPAIARPSSLERRVTAMLNARVNRAPLTRAAASSASSRSSPSRFRLPASFRRPSSRSPGPSSIRTAGSSRASAEVLTDTLRDAKHQVKTDTGGRFEFVGLPAGDYRARRDFAGFMPIRDAISLNQPVVEKGASLGSRIDPGDDHDRRRRRPRQQPWRRRWSRDASCSRAYDRAARHPLAAACDRRRRSPMSNRVSAASQRPSDRRRGRAGGHASAQTAP